MTVYVTSEELLDIEHARLALRSGHGLAVDRGRLLREAVSLVLADFEEQRRQERAGPPAERGMTADPSMLGDGPRRGREARRSRSAWTTSRVPFDLLLSLISKHKLDITEVVALAGHRRVHRARQGRRVGRDGGEWDLEQTSSFLLVAATLLDLKAARLLPQGDVEDEEDLALLEARDLLFARLLQYRAFKQVAGVLATRLAGESRRHPRAVGLEDRFATPAARGAHRHRARPVRPAGGQGAGAQAGGRAVRCTTSTPPRVSVREQAALVIERLRRSGAMTFRALCGDSPDTLTTVARFLSLLELFREGAVGFDQVSPLGELTVRWTGSDDADADELVHDEFDGAPPDVPSEEAPTDQPSRGRRHDPGHARRRDDRARARRSRRC